MKELTQERLKELLGYNPDTGEFKWTEDGAGRRTSLTAGSINQNGYLIISINGNSFSAHRLAFLYMTGRFPLCQCDHINHNRIDNRWLNLTDVTHLENQKNRSLQKSNTSGFTGVNWHKHDKKWQSSIQVKGKQIYLGSFLEKEDAIDARIKAETEHGFHPNHGRSA